MDKNTARNEVLLACAELVKLGLVARTWGNVSCRIDEKQFALTPSGISYDRLVPDMIAAVNMYTLEYEGDIKPSSEKGIHAAAYRMNPDTNFVIHTHQTCATILGVAGFETLKPTTEEKSVLGGEIALSKYGLPGTKKLRKNVACFLESGSSVILMEKHGVLICGDNREITFKRASLLENVCRREIPSFIVSDGLPDGISRFTGNGKFLYKTGRAEKEYAYNDDNLPFLLKIHKVLLSSYTDAKVLVHRKSEACAAVLKSTKKLPAVLDDFAQMVGGYAECVSSCDPSEIAKGFKKNNAVLAPELGNISFAEDESDAHALLVLTEKNALAFLNARQHGKPAALSLLDRKLMRFVYLTKYSRKK
jgi:L-ribulose-5-phosphate 4-epimerase